MIRLVPALTLAGRVQLMAIEPTGLGTVDTVKTSNWLPNEPDELLETVATILSSGPMVTSLQVTFCVEWKSATLTTRFKNVGLGSCCSMRVSQLTGQYTVAVLVESSLKTPFWVLYWILPTSVLAGWQAWPELMYWWVIWA